MCVCVTRGVLSLLLCEAVLIFNGHYRPGLCICCTNMSLERKRQQDVVGGLSAREEVIE